VGARGAPGRSTDFGNRTVCPHAGQAYSLTPRCLSGVRHFGQGIGLAETQAANSLISTGVDVITQHQDCPGAVISAAAQHNVNSVGIHADAQALNPKGWVTGTQWNWAPMYEAIVTKAQSGTFKGSQFNSNYVASYTDPLNPVQLSPFGSIVSADAQQKVAAVQKNIETGVSPFSGPLTDSTGKLEIPPGTTLPYEQINQINWLVAGVIGKVSS